MGLSSQEFLTGVYSTCTHKKTSNVSSGQVIINWKIHKGGFFIRYKKNTSNKKRLYRNNMENHIDYANSFIQCFMVGLQETFSYRLLKNILTITLFLYLKDFTDFYHPLILRIPLYFTRVGSTTAVNIVTILSTIYLFISESK